MEETADSIKPRRLKSSDKLPPESHREYLDMDTDEEEFGHQETPEPQDEAPPEPEKPNYTSEEVENLIEKIKKLTILSKLTEKSWNINCHEVMKEYFREPCHTTLSIFFVGKKLHAQHDFPKGKVDGIAYFMRTEYWQIFQPEDLTRSIRFGNFNRTSTENYLYRFMNNVYAPFAFKNKSWPQVMKDQIFSNLNGTIAQAIDVTYKPLGILILYVPWEGTEEYKYDSAVHEGVSQYMPPDQELLIDRLEKIANTWVKKIRESLEVLRIKIHDIHNLTNEFEFWQSRYDNLTIISKQLKKEKLLFILKQLKSARSISLEGLKLLNERVTIATDEAKSNLTYLNFILNNCKTNDPKSLQNCMAKVLYIIIVVSTESSYYTKHENLERILCSFSVYTVNICSKNFDSKSIFDNPKECKKTLETNLKCCKYYSNIYDDIIKSCCTNIEKNNWKIEKKIVFNDIYNFEQRCRDVIEICDAMLIYGGLNKFHFGGTKGHQYEMNYKQVSDYFSLIMKQMRIHCNYALNITAMKWYQDILKFRKNIAKLENTIMHIFKNLFDDVKNLEMGIETLYTLLKFKDRRGFQHMLHNKWIQIWKIFYKEIDKCLSSEVDKIKIVQDQIKRLPVESATMNHTNKNYLARLQKMIINASDWFQDSDNLQFEMPSALSNLKIKC